MGKKLHTIGAFAFKHPIWVIGGWLIVLAILGFAALQFYKPASSSISIPGTEAQSSLDRMNELFPGAGKGSGRIVFAAPEGKTITDYSAVIANTTVQLNKVDGIVKAIDITENPTALSSDKTIAYTQIQLKEGQGMVSESTMDSVTKIVTDARKDGLQVEEGGDIIKREPGEILGVAEVAGVVIALLVLILTLGSLIAAGMPIVTALIAIGVTMSGLFSLSQVITISSTTPTLAVMLGLAVGIDYSLFIINRYRMYVFEGFSYKDAAARAIGTAGNAVIFAAATVVIALASLTVVQIPFMTSMGLTAAAAIAIAAAVSITLIPAMLRLSGRFAFSSRARKKIEKLQKAGPHEDHHADRTTFWYRWGLVITKHPALVLVACIALIAVIALPIQSLKLGLPTDEYASTSTTERKAYDLLAKGFGPGFNGPLIVVVEDLPGITVNSITLTREQILQQINTKIAEGFKDQQVALQNEFNAVTTEAQQVALDAKLVAARTAYMQQFTEASKNVDQTAQQNVKYLQVNKVVENIKKDTRVVSAVPAAVTEEGTSALIQIVPTSGPSDQKTTDLINDIRDNENQQKLTGNVKTKLSVTGSTALQNDINTKLAAALPVYLTVVIGLSFALLVIAFRSILVPLTATLGFLLSVLAMFGALVAVFQWGWFGVTDAAGPIVSFTPIIAIGILFGLAMDYEFFLVTSMQEAYYETKDAKRSVLRGFAHASKVVLAAAVIMVAVFTGFVFNHDSTVQAIGFALAFGIFIDAFIVRLTIIPAVMKLLGRSAWWLPKWLDKILPHVSIEGEADPALKK